MLFGSKQNQDRRRQFLDLAWTSLADANRRRASAALSNGDLVTARSNWLRAITYHQAAAFPFEFADAAYKRFDDMAQLIMIDIHARETGERKSQLEELKRDDTPDLRGGMKYVDSPRHANYVERGTYLNYIAAFRERFGWPDLDENSYAELELRTLPESKPPAKENAHA